MNKTKIDWCDSTWNPITGCLHRCEYCYARNIARRFSYEGETLDAPAELQKTWIEDSLGSGAGRYVLRYPVDTVDGRKVPYPFGFAPTLHKYRLNDYLTKKGRNIFVCSMADMFGDWVPDSWLDEVFAACEKAPQHNYLFLTKNPARYSKNLGGYGVSTASNMWYGTTITKEENAYKFNYLPSFCNSFVSIEPLLEDIEPGKCNIMFRQVDWFIIGAETGRRKDKVVPERKWIEDIVSECRKYGKPVFMKSSLAPIWGENLIQEFPAGLQKSAS